MATKKLISHFSYKSQVVRANVPVGVDVQGTFLTIRSVTGTVEMKINGQQEWIPVIGKMTVKLAGKEQFKTIDFKSTAGGTVNYFSGVGEISFGSGTSSNGEYIDSFDDPNGNILPDDTSLPAIYYKDDDTPVTVWLWSVANQNWFVAIS